MIRTNTALVPRRSIISGSPHPQQFRHFLVHKNTVWAWARDFDRKENVGTFFGNMPWNRIADGVRWLVHEIRAICPEPEFGTRSVAIALVREGIAISRSSVRNILKEKKPKRPPEPILNTFLTDRKPNPILNPTSINKTWHFDLCTLELVFLRFYIATILDGFSRKILALSVYRDAPTSNQMLRLLKKTIAAFGKPKFLVTDHGTQFCGRFRKTVRRKLAIRPVRGRIRFGYFMNGKIERFFRSFRIWSRLLLFPRTMKGIQNRLDVYRDWYNTKRGLWLHGGRTPEDVWQGKEFAPPVAIREREPMKPAITVKRHRFRGDPGLPVIEIQVVRASSIAA
ncbi:MAG: DDE-type integrase/transposase/recombinase [Planctomycetota bacterium]